MIAKFSGYVFLCVGALALMAGSSGLASASTSSDRGCFNARTACATHICSTAPKLCAPGPPGENCQGC